jgi:heptosyltransferase-2
MKVLCICPIGIGNYLLIYPACAALLKSRPDLELHLLGLRSGIGDIAERDPLWRGISVFDPVGTKGDLRRQAGIVYSLRKEHYNACISFFPSNKWMYNLLPFLAGIPLRYGFVYRSSPLITLSFLCNRRIAVDTSLHDVRQNMNIAARFCDNPSIAGMTLEFPGLAGAEDAGWAKEFLKPFGAGPFIALHAGSSSEHGMIYKRWAPGRFAAVADRICNYLGAKCVIVGGKSEEPVKKAVSDAMTAPVIMLPQVSLGKTAALLGKCSLCLCNDSGIMHIASCGKVPTIAVFGPTDEKRNGPAGEKALVVRKHVPGFPVWTAENVGNRRLARGVDPAASLKALSAKDAWEQIKPWLESVYPR